MIVEAHTMLWKVKGQAKNEISLRCRHIGPADSLGIKTADTNCYPKTIPQQNISHTCNYLNVKNQDW